MIVSNISELKKIIKELRELNLKVGCISGSFDLLHKGHKEAINFSKENCDELIVLINSDRSIKRYKGPKRPIQNETTRIENLNNFNKNCYFYLFDDLIPNNLIEDIKPEVYFLADEWISSPVESLVIGKYGGKIQPHPNLEGESTTKYADRFSESKGAIFLDRDGTINKDFGYINSTKNILIKDIDMKGLVKMSELNYYIFIITNQSGISKGLVTEKEVNNINKSIVETIVSNGGRVDKVYYDKSDSHKPSKFRKPNTGMLELAVKEFGVSLSKSWIIGDKDTDVLTGKFSNMKTIYKKNKKYDYKSILSPDYEVNNLYEAFKIIKN